MALTGNLTVRRLAPAEWPAAFPIMVQLRPHLDEAEFLDRVRRQSHGGYELAGAFDGTALIGVLGMRPVHTLARGAHLHIDDLVVDESLRGSGAGKALMAFAENDAKARGMGLVFLDARSAAIPFYEGIGFAFHPSPSMRKTL